MFSMIATHHNRDPEHYPPSEYVLQIFIVSLYVAFLCAPLLERSVLVGSLFGIFWLALGATVAAAVIWNFGTPQSILRFKLKATVCVLLWSAAGMYGAFRLSLFVP